MLYTDHLTQRKEFNRFIENDVLGPYGNILRHVKIHVVNVFHWPDNLIYTLLNFFISFSMSLFKVSILWMH